VQIMESAGTPSTILLVDDDQALRRFARRILVKERFRVVEAADGAEALQVAAGFVAPIALLVTDVIMPKVNGLVLAERLSRERPGIRVLYISGYIEKAMLLKKVPDAVLLQKPFTPDALVTTVRQVLASIHE
jgi:two-component system cell cycle sensor histidine kinase/response regulator CckA